MIHFFIEFSWLLILSSFFIVSFFHLTRNWIIINPDNSEKIEGDLLKYWSFIIEKKKKIKRIYYSGDALLNKMNMLIKMNYSIASKFSLSPEKFSIILNESLSDKEKEEIEILLSCRSEWNDKNMFLYIEDVIYFLPKWIRFPLSQCVVCMSSVYGSIIWWTTILMNKNMFNWSNNLKLSYFVFWVIFVVILSQINRIVYRKTLEYV